MEDLLKSIPLANKEEREARIAVDGVASSEAATELPAVNSEDAHAVVIANTEAQQEEKDEAAAGDEEISDEERERRRIASLEAVVAAKRRRVERDDAVRLLRDDYLSAVIGGIEAQTVLATFAEEKKDDKKKGAVESSLPPLRDRSGNLTPRAVAAHMPLFQQRNELYVAYMEFDDEEIAELGRAIFENPLIAATVNHINFAGNAFTPERFALFAHLVLCPLLFFSGALACVNRIDGTNCAAPASQSGLLTGGSNGYVNHEAIDDEAVKANLGKLLEKIGHSLRFSGLLQAYNRNGAHARPATAKFMAEQREASRIAAGEVAADSSNAQQQQQKKKEGEKAPLTAFDEDAALFTAAAPESYASDAAVRNASSGYGAGFGITGIECDNNGGSTDGWRSLVALLTADPSFVIADGEAVRAKHLGPKGEDKSYYTLTGAFARLLSETEESMPPSDPNAPGYYSVDEEILGYVGYHASTTLCHIEIAENYMHDVGARYAALLLEGCPNLKYASFITNQLSSRAAKDFKVLFEDRYEAMGEANAAAGAASAADLSSGVVAVVVPPVPAADVEAMISEVAAVTEADDEETAKDRALAAATLRSIVASSKLVADSSENSEKKAECLAALPYTISPAAYQSYPYLASPRLVEAGHPFCLQQLYLDYNSFGDAGADTALAAIGAKCPSLAKLGFSDNRLADGGGAAVARHIVANPHSRVQHLNLSVNTIGDAGGEAIAKALCCAYVVPTNTVAVAAEAAEAGSSYTLFFKKGVRFDRPVAHAYDVDTDLFIDELSGLPSSSAAAAGVKGIPVIIVPAEEDGEDGLGEGEAYAARLSFTNAGVTLTQQQVDLLLVPSHAEAEARGLAAINTRLYHIDLANQTRCLGPAGRSAILSLAFGYKYLMNLDVTALDIANSEMRLLVRALQLGATAQIDHAAYYCNKNNANANNDAAPSSSLWGYTCGIVNAEWYNNPAIFPATEQLMGAALEAAIEQCQCREAFVETYLKSSTDNTVLCRLRAAARARVAGAFVEARARVAVPNAGAASLAAKKSARAGGMNSMKFVLFGAAAVAVASALVAKTFGQKK